MLLKQMLLQQMLLKQMLLQQMLLKQMLLQHYWKIVVESRVENILKQCFSRDCCRWNKIFIRPQTKNFNLKQNN